MVPRSRRSHYPEHIFKGKDDDAVALRFASELRDLDAWTWGELRAQTAAIAAALKRLGVGRGDRVAAYMPNIPETVAAFLAVSSLGAVWSSAAPEFGSRSVIDRFTQIEPKVLLAVDGYRYGGKDFDRGGQVGRDRGGDADGGEGREVRLSRRIGLGGRVPRPTARWLRPAPVRPSPLGALQLGHDRAAEADRSGPRRDPDRAAEEGRAAPRCPRRRSLLLVLDDGLDDVELPRRRAAHRRLDHPVRRQPRLPGPEDAVGPGRARPE